MNILTRMLNVEKQIKGKGGKGCKVLWVDPNDPHLYWEKCPLDNDDRGQCYGEEEKDQIAAEVETLVLVEYTTWQIAQDGKE